MMRYFSLRFCGFVVFTTLFGALTAFAQTTADFNGDGKLDIVQIVQCFPTPCTNSTIIVRLGQGNGSFRAPINSPTIGFPSVETVVGDFNSDKRLDIAFASFASPGEQIAVALGNGDGTFGATTLYPVPYPSSPFSVGDLNGDTKLDLVVSGPTLSVLLNNGDGTFRALPDAPPGAFAECALADANHDGKVDLIGGSIQLGNGDGTFQPPQTIVGPGNCPLVADFNGDGNVDVINSIKGGIDLYLGNGNGTFKPAVRKWLYPGEAVLQIGDFNGDGRPDLFASNAQVNILLNAGNGAFRLPVGYLCLCGVLGDFNGDGRTDVANFRAPVIAILARADGTLPLPRSFQVPGARSGGSLATADTNGDRKSDLIIVND